MSTKVYLFIATDERAFAHSTIEGAKSEWEKVRHNWVDTHKCNWYDTDENENEIYFKNILAMKYEDTNEEIAWIAEMEVIHDTPVINAVAHA